MGEIAQTHFVNDFILLLDLQCLVFASDPQTLGIEIERARVVTSCNESAGLCCVGIGGRFDAIGMAGFLGIAGLRQHSRLVWQTDRGQ